MKKISSGSIFILLFLIFGILVIPKNTFAQQIQNTGVTLKNSTNTAVLYSGGVNLDQTAIAYTTGQVEFPFSSTNVEYDSSYSFTMDYYFNVPYTSDYNNFGWGNPSLYIFSNGLVQQSMQISQFNNTLQACNALACTYRLNLAFTFATNASGYLYLAIPVSPVHNIYGWHYNYIDLVSYGQNTSNSDIINNNNQNTQNIISNNNQNTQTIINNNNQNTDKIIESEKVCTLYDKSKVNIEGKNFNLSGSIINSSGNGITDFIPYNNGELSLVKPSCSEGGSCLAYPICFYDSTQTLISCSNSVGTISVPINTNYFRYSVNLEGNYPKFSYCTTGNQALSDNISNMNNSLNNSDTSQAQSDLSSFFDNFQVNNHGLASLISSPLRLLQTLNSSSCSSLIFPLPFVNKNATLPCFKPIVQTHFSTFLTLYQLITNGLVAYWVCINLFAKVKGFQDPQSDKIEVLEL